MPTFKLPGVHVEEIALSPPSVAEVATAVPAFVGYTEKAGDRRLRPTRIASLQEYVALFGDPYPDPIALALAGDAAAGYTASAPATLHPGFLLAHAIRLYFDNGGGPCSVTSVGSYSDAIAWTGGLQDGLAAVAREDEPTLVVIPEAVRLGADYATLVKAVLEQCAALRDRFGIFDAFGGAAPYGAGNALEDERARFPGANLCYGAVYYPFIRTSIRAHVTAAEDNVTVRIGADAFTLGELRTGRAGGPPQPAAHAAAKAALATVTVTTPPSGAVAGVYAATDRARGVWKAPANVALAGVIEPAVKLDSAAQDQLNVDPSGGKSINAVRAFAGKGTLVWGARTLAGNDNEWRYVPVRRLFIAAEESIRKSTSWAVFEPNDANTWTKVRATIESYLVQKWRQGALLGARPEHAFFVKCGLGATMTAQDVLEGRMSVEVGMAAVRPAEFIVLRLGYRMQAP